MNKMFKPNKKVGKGSAKKKPAQQEINTKANYFNNIESLSETI